MRRFRMFAGIALALALVLLGSACSRTSAGSISGSRGSEKTSFPLTMTDDQGTKVTLDSAPQKIVTWGPSMTEILFALGEGSKIVGVSGSFDNYPAAALGIAHVGTPQIQPNVEKVVSLHPDLVISAFSGGGQWEQQLRSAGIPVFTIVSTDLSDVFTDIQEVGRLTGASSAADRLTATLTSRYESLRQQISGVAAVPCFYEVSYNPLYTVGPGSFIYDILQRAGCAPVTSTAHSAYPQWSLESLVQEDPSVYIASADAVSSASLIESRPGYSALAAVKQGHVYVIDSDIVDRPGPRIVDGVQLLASLLHPGLVSPPSATPSASPS